MGSGKGLGDFMDITFGYQPKALRRGHVRPGRRPDLTDPPTPPTWFGLTGRFESFEASL